MKNLTFLLTISFLCLVSCTQKVKHDENLSFGKPNFKVESIVKDFKTWWYYHNTYIALESDFIAISESSVEITKRQFLERLKTGKFIPIKLKNEDATHYQLYQIKSGMDNSIGSTMKSTSAVLLHYFNMEGKAFPNFYFEDVNAERYTSESIQGKTMVIKCWFIGCHACVEEFPELNNLVGRYEDNEKIEFISLALDKSEALKKFLKKKPFTYKVIPEQADFMQDMIGVLQYPTHFIINENGVIEKVYSNAKQVIAYIDSTMMLKTAEM